ncbi:carbonic anhydrase 14-like isoform X1 [Tribolium madens]|uniref:carbonic anhydrase 14-like isoform X1 n=1 Tax=Tribolium madens TaxID=41895 RepID=UPI001CF7264A|nr:carbonic anhydrase 14-like isoform X1 [Tribolium madens]XP_044258082.1 carbonic anhydrase 14-like isoform X1 [Tribolium madens]XP_044258083.1 carbonic anhydrase 14-like isoform X1 [Tribolium madens]XP_044258084.1 carbonic anhydrase 14-like isoform X1 [Tribolium madens]
MQSPINITEDMIPQHFTTFHFCGYNQIYNAAITYTEHGININFLDSKLPTVSGAGLYKEYVLTALDFHWDSEHLIDNQRYPLEGQLIHYAKKYENFKNALNYKDGVAIFSTFFNITENSNDAFENLIETIPVIRMKIDHQVKLLQPIIPRHFLSDKIGKFYRYNGSLTTPCFDETVIWTIFSTPNHISQTQLEELQKKWEHLNKSRTTNYRELQDDNDRRIYFSLI